MPSPSPAPWTYSYVSFQLLSLPNNIPWQRDAAFMLLQHRWMAKQEITEIVSPLQIRCHAWTLWSILKQLCEEIMRASYCLKDPLHGVEVQRRTEIRITVLSSVWMPDISAFYEFSSLQSTLQPLSSETFWLKMLLEVVDFKEKLLLYESLWGLGFQGQIEAESAFGPDVTQNSSYMTDGNVEMELMQLWNVEVLCKKMEENYKDKSTEDDPGICKNEHQKIKARNSRWFETEGWGSTPCFFLPPLN